MSGEITESVEAVGEIEPGVRVAVRVRLQRDGTAVLREGWYPEVPSVLLGHRREVYEATRYDAIAKAVHVWGADVEVIDA